MTFSLQELHLKWSQLAPDQETLFQQSLASGELVGKGIQKKRFCQRTSLTEIQSGLLYLVWAGLIYLTWSILFPLVLTGSVFNSGSGFSLC